VRFPSLTLVLTAFGAAVRRFPWSVAAALMAMVSGILLVDSHRDHDPLIQWLAAGSLGLALLTGLTVTGERRSRPSALLLPLIGVAALAAVIALWPGWTDPVKLRRYLQLSLGFHLIAAWLPYAGRGEANGFWQYNRHLFLRFLLGGLYSAVLYLGLSVALLALDKLFGIHIDENHYLRLWIVIAFGFQTLFFLGGLPVSFADLDADTRYPTGLKVFSQFILLPIVVLYLVILTGYMAKIAVTRVWPSGWIGYMVSSVAAVGILSLLLVHPVQERAENRWVKSYGRWFYIALFPSIVMLLLAVWKRVHQYGITENRYFLVVLSLWLAGIAIYYMLSRAKRIQVIPMTLCALAFLTAFGPWGAYSVSARSQIHRLVQLLDESGMLAGGAVQPPPEPLTLEQRRDLSGVVRYLVETHGRDAVTERLDWPAIAVGDTAAAGSNPVADARALLAAAGVEYANPWDGRNDRFFHLYPAPEPQAIDVSGYDYAVRVESALPVTVEVASHRLEFALAPDAPALIIRKDAVESLRLSLDPVLARAREERANGGDPGGGRDEPLLITGEGGSLRVLARILGADGEFMDEDAVIRSLRAEFYLRLESSPE